MAAFVSSDTGAVVRVGYAGQNLTLGTVTRGVRVAGFTGERCIALARANTASIIRVLRWNTSHGIDLFRLSSRLIPLGSHPECDVDWARELAGELARVGELARAGGLRLSMHPGQYTRLASARHDVREASVRDLAYHARLMDAMGLEPCHPMVVHVGGRRGEGRDAAGRFEDGFEELPEPVGRRLAVENDEWGQGARDVLELCGRIGRPAVIDLHHERVRRRSSYDPAPLIRLAAATWAGPDGPPKIHLSSGLSGPLDHRHAPLIDRDDWLWALSAIDRAGVDRMDVMVEAKQKDRAVLELEGGGPWRRVPPCGPCQPPTGGERCE